MLHFAPRLGAFPVEISYTPLSRPVTKEDITSFVKSVSRLIYEIFTFEVKCYSISHRKNNSYGRNNDTEKIL